MKKLKCSRCREVFDRDDLYHISFFDKYRSICIPCYFEVKKKYKERCRSCFAMVPETEIFFERGGNCCGDCRHTEFLEYMFPDLTL